MQNSQFINSQFINCNFTNSSFTNNKFISSNGIQTCFVNPVILNTTFNGDHYEDLSNVNLGLIVTSISPCPSNSDCSSIGRSACSESYTPRACGPCLAGYTADDGTTSSPGDSVCLTDNQRQNGCPTVASCASLNRNPCQDSFSTPTCGSCFAGFATSTGDSSSNSNSQCNDINECNNNPCDPNAYCANMPGAYTCTCNTGFAGDGTTCEEVCGQRIRREWFSLTPQQQDQWIRAVNQLFTSGQYTQYVNMHTTYASQAHGQPLFVYWHRPLVHWIEDGLRALGGEFSCLAQPYWDWTNSETVASIFTNAYSGNYRIGLGTKDGNCFSGSHPFAGWKFGNACVYRSAMTTPTTLPTPQALASNMQTNVFQQVRSIIETAHNNVHIWVGGTMSYVPISPQDPVFWLHHAMVDQLFAVWQDCHGGDNIQTIPTPTGSTFTQVWETGTSQSFSNNMPGWSYSAAQVWNTVKTFNVRYQRTWLDSAFGGASWACPANMQTWLASYQPRVEITNTTSTTEPQNNNKHLMAINNNNNNNHDNNKNSFSLMSLRKHRRSVKHKKSNTQFAWQPSSRYLAEQTAIYEVYKDTYTQTNNRTLALDKAYVKSCLMKPALTAKQAQLFTDNYIHMMHLELECSLGWCKDLCYKRLQLPH